MAEVIKETPETNLDTTKPEHTEVELRAMESGWVPEEEWEGDKAQWRPAKEFLDRGELFKKIDDQNRTIKEFKRSLDDLKGHHARVRETEYTRALASLKEQKVSALEDGDAKRAVQLDDQIDLVKDEQLKLRQQKQQPVEQDNTPVPEFVSWVNRNKWYDTNQPMRAYADALGRDLAAAGKQPTDVLKEVERQVREEFPNKFRNVNRDKPGSVEASTNKGGKSNDSFTLSDDERRVMDRFVRSGVMTKEQYIKDLKSVRGE
jgi:hypothetical protein